MNSDKIQSRARHSKYQIQYTKKGIYPGLRENLVLETYFYQNAFPVVTRKISNYIYDYLEIEQRANEVIISYPELTPFMMNVQTLERTCIDKVFAICDRYLAGEVMC